jgi:hypothetical protein
MKRFISFLLVLRFTAFGAVRTASVTGDWSNTATWGGSAAPVSGDSVNINGDIVVTINSGDIVACGLLQIANTANSSGISTLVINGKLSIDTTLSLRVGSTTSGKDGKIIFGPGGELALAASSQLSLNSCQLRSTATQVSPAKITGAGSISFLATGPRQDIGLTNVMFMNTSTITIPLQDTLGVNNSSFVLKNCGFIGNATIAIGTTTTPNTCPISITYSDIRELTSGKSITLRRIAGGVAAYEFRHNTIYQTSTPFTLALLTSEGMQVTDNVGWNWIIQSTDAFGGNKVVAHNIFASSMNTPGIWGPTDAATADVYTNNYIFQLPAGDNLHCYVPTASSTGGSGTVEMGWNIFETQGGTPYDDGDFIVDKASGLPLNVHHNLIVGVADLAVGTHAGAWSKSMTFKNNVISGNEGRANGIPSVTGNTGVGNLWDPEGVANGGTINIANNLLYGTAKVGDTTIAGTSSGGAQTIAYSDYNSFYNIATPYTTGIQLVVSSGNTGRTVPAAHDTASLPMFYDSYRDIQQWNYLYGSGTQTFAAAVDYFMGINGYRGTPNFDQNGTVSTHQTNMFNWVRQGYLTTNPALRAAGDPGDGSPDLGIGYTGLKGAIGTFFGAN